MKILKDLMKHGEKFGRKSFMLISSFIFMLLLGTFIVMSDSVLNVEINRYAIDVFDTLNLFVLAMAGITVTDKKIKNNTGEE